MFPVFARARENARRASCQSNLKQIGLGVMQYTQDYDEKYPLRQYGGAGLVNDGKVMSWRRAIFPYVKSTQLFACPSNTYNSQPPDDSNAGDMVSQGLPAGSPVFPSSYVINANSGTIDGNGGTAPSEYDHAESLASVPNTAQTILVNEFSWVTAEFPFNYSVPDYADPSFTFKGHLGTSNFLFCDGHVKALKPVATVTATNMWTTEDNDVTNAWVLDRMRSWQNLVDGS